MALGIKSKDDYSVSPTCGKGSELGKKNENWEKNQMMRLRNENSLASLSSKSRKGHRAEILSDCGTQEEEELGA